LDFSKFTLIGAFVGQKLPEFVSVTESADSNSKAKGDGTSYVEGVASETSHSSGACVRGHNRADTLSGTEGGAGKSEDCTQVKSGVSSESIPSMLSVNVLASAPVADSLSLDKFVILENHFANNLLIIS